MTEYSVVKMHLADNITLLCGSHHDQKTRGLLTELQVREHDAKPFNLHEGKTAAEMLSFDPGDFMMILGNCSFEQRLKAGAKLVPVMILGEPQLSFRYDHGQLLLSCVFRDHQGRVLMRVDEGEMVHATEVWDVEREGRRLTVRAQARDILLDLELDPVHSALTVRQGRFFSFGREVVINEKGIFFPQIENFVADLSFALFEVGVAVGATPEGTDVAFEIGT